MGAGPPVTPCQEFRVARLRASCDPCTRWYGGCWRAQGRLGCGADPSAVSGSPFDGGEAVTVVRWRCRASYWRWRSRAVRWAVRWAVRGGRPVVPGPADEGLCGPQSDERRHWHPVVARDVAALVAALLSGPPQGGGRELARAQADPVPTTGSTTGSTPRSTTRSTTRSSAGRCR